MNHIYRSAAVTLLAVATTIGAAHAQTESLDIRTGVYRGQRVTYQPELTMLAAGVDSLVDEEGGFRTFFFPPERVGGNWNFYSGEALLFWAEARRRGVRFAPSLERYAAAFARCRDRHDRARNPAFVPSEISSRSDKVSAKHERRGGRGRMPPYGAS